MSDELDDLKRAFDAATPAPDPARKAESLRLAQENFGRFQGSRGGARQTDQLGPMGRLLIGGRKMMDAMTSKAGLTATTALVAVGLVAVLPNLNTMIDPVAELGQREGAVVDDVVLEDEARNLAPPQQAPSTRNAADADLESSVSTEVLRRQAADGSLQNAPTPRADETTSSAREPKAMTPEALIASPANDAVMAGRGHDDFSVPQVEMEESVDSIILPGDLYIAPTETGSETFPDAPESALKVTTEDPVSTFSIDVDTASYAVVRSSLMSGMLPPAGAVRVEEMINYFPYDYASPNGAHPFEPTITVTDTPWNSGTQIVHIGIQGTLPALADRPPLNLVFLIDTSGSMQDANKLPLLKQSFRLMLSELRAEDEVSIVTYAGSAGQVLKPTPASERSTILTALDQLQAGGSTAGQAGLQQAYSVAEGMADEGEVTRVILATDGDFNVGLSDPVALEAFISVKRDSGTYLSVLGFGRGNLDDATMQALAQNGNGTAAYIDTLSEARKVLVDQLTGALFPIANDVKIQVEFNPAEVAEYRLIGYETRALAREDFSNDRVDAGDIGAGHSVTAVYEITPVGSDAVRNGPLRYDTRDAPVSQTGELGFFKMRYKQPGARASILLEEPILPKKREASDDVRFSLAIAGFAQLLRDSPYIGAWDWGEAIALATEAKGDDPYGYRAESVTLMRLAEALGR